MHRLKRALSLELIGNQGHRRMSTLEVSPNTASKISDGVRALLSKYVRVCETRYQEGYDLLTTAEQDITFSAQDKSAMSETTERT